MGTEISLRFDRIMKDDELDAIADRLAPRIVAKVREGKHEFWIDPEIHYNSHRDGERLKELFTSEDYSSIKKLVQLYNLTTSLFAKAFIGLAIVGALALSFFGLFWKK